MRAAIRRQHARRRRAVRRRTTRKPASCLRARSRWRAPTRTSANRRSRSRISPGVHNRLGYIAQAADEYEALLPMLERDRQPTQYAAVLGELRLLPDRARRFRSRARDAHRSARAVHGERRGRRARCQAGRARRPLFPHRRRRARARNAARCDHRTGTGRRHAGTREHAARRGQRRRRRSVSTTAALEYLRRSAHIDGESEQRRAHARSHRDASCAPSATCAPPKRSSPRRRRIHQCAGAAPKPSKNARTCASRSRTSPAAIEDLRAADQHYADARPRVQPHRHQHRAVAGAAAQP